MADFLLTGRVNTEGLIKDITEAFKEANRRLTSVKVKLDIGAARAQMVGLRNIFDKEIVLKINTQSAQAKVNELKQQLGQIAPTAQPGRPTSGAAQDARARIVAERRQFAEFTQMRINAFQLQF